MAARVFDIRLRNETTIVIHRHSHSVRHGAWSSWLPERVFPGSEITISCALTRTFNGVCFSLDYGAVLNRVRFLLRLQLERVGGEEVLSADFLPEAEFDKGAGGRGASSDSTCPVIFKVHRALLDTSNGDRFCRTYCVRAQETADGTLFIKGLKDCIEELVQRRGDERRGKPAAGGIEAYRAYEALPDDFTWSASSAAWLPRLRKSNRSVLIRIVNLCGKDLKLQVGVGGTDLEEGHWVEYPSEDLPHLCGTEFGVRSNGYFGGTCGRCVYTIPGESGALTFSWEQPSIGSLGACGAHSQGKYFIAKHYEPLNEATLVFHVYDVTPPALDIWAAKAISPSAPSKLLDLATLPVDQRGYHVFDRIARSPTLSRLENAPPPVVDVLRLLLRHQQHDHEGGAHAAPRTESIPSEADEPAGLGASVGTELFLKSPHHFIQSAIMGKRRDLSRLPARSLLYLDWGIGNERFAKIFLPEERIHLRSSIPGGMASKKLLFRSRLMSFRCDRPEVFRDAAAAASPALSARALHARPFLRAPSQAELMDYVLMIFHSLCEGLQPYVTKRMLRKYGADWIDQVRVPVGHVWRSEDQVRIDVEGMIYLITAYMLEVFEKLFEGDSATLNVIQTAAIYWANQELYRFDPAYVWDMLEATKRLLQRLRAESALHQIDFISQKLIVQ